MRTVYAVAHGEYSDHHILCLFERHEDAEGYLAALVAASKARKFDQLAHDPPHIEEYELWDAVPVFTVGEATWRLDVTNVAR
jgi:hypothetical protein